MDKEYVRLLEAVAEAAQVQHEAYGACPDLISARRALANYRRHGAGWWVKVGPMLLEALHNADRELRQDGYTTTYPAVEIIRAAILASSEETPNNA